MWIGDGRLTEGNNALLAREDEAVDEAAAAALADFDGVWEVLAPREQARVLELLIQHVEHEGQRGNISIMFRLTGIKTLFASNSDDVVEQLRKLHPSDAQVAVYPYGGIQHPPLELDDPA